MSRHLKFCKFCRQTTKLPQHTSCHRITLATRQNICADPDQVGYSYLRFPQMASQQTLLEYLTTTKIGEKGQVTVPKQFREDLGLGTGAPLVVFRLGDGLILMPQQERFERLCSEISSALRANGIPPKAVLATLPKARERIFERRYGPGAREETASQRRGSRSRAK